MSAEDSAKRDAARAQYDAAAEIAPQFDVLNYGFSADADDGLVPPGHPEFYCLRLYEHTVRDADLGGRDVLEVSCGRGGGAAFLARALAPRRYVGVDLSEQNVRLAASRHGAANLEFAVGDAQSLEMGDAAFDVVVNVEASHLYDDRRAFFAEALRVLRPGGYFCYADGCWHGDDCTGELLDAGFELLERREITRNVLRALRLDSARREAIVASLPEPLRDEYRDWSGVVGYRAFRRFESGETRYFSHRLRRPA